MFGRITTHRTKQTDTLGHSVIGAAQGIGSNIIPVMLGMLLGLLWHYGEFFSIIPTHFQCCSYRLIYGGRRTACGGWAELVSRLRSTKYILSWSRKVLNQYVHIIVQVHGYRNLHWVPKTTKANAAQNITLCLKALSPYKVQQDEHRS